MTDTFMNLNMNYFQAVCTNFFSFLVNKKFGCSLVSIILYPFSISKLYVWINLFEDFSFMVVELSWNAWFWIFKQFWHDNQSNWQEHKLCFRWYHCTSSRCKRTANVHIILLERPSRGAEASGGPPGPQKVCSRQIHLDPLRRPFGLCQNFGSLGRQFISCTMDNRELEVPKSALKMEIVHLILYHIQAMKTYLPEK